MWRAPALSASKTRNGAALQRIFKMLPDRYEPSLVGIGVAVETGSARDESGGLAAREALEFAAD
jgi:hypothetical protein